MADPIEEKHRAFMNSLAEAIDELVNPPGGPRKIVFTLLMAETGRIEGGRVNYISNGERDDMVAMLRELLARFGGAYDQPGGRA